MVDNMNDKTELSSENLMDSPLHIALHYVQCYGLHFPDSDAKSVAAELVEIIENMDVLSTVYFVRHDEPAKYDQVEFSSTTTASTVITDESATWLIAE